MVDEIDPSYLPAQETIALERYELSDPGLARRSGSNDFRAAVASFSRKPMFEDIVDQGIETVPALAKELERGSLYLWWD